MRKFPLLDEKNLENFLANHHKQFENKIIPHPMDGIIFTCHPRFGESLEHHHDYIEMVYVYSGECKQVIDGKPITMNKGDVCILNTNVLHSVLEASENDIIINCLMSKKYLDNILLDRLSGNDLLSSFLFAHYMVIIILKNIYSLILQNPKNFQNSRMRFYVNILISLFVQMKLSTVI